MASPQPEPSDQARKDSLPSLSWSHSGSPIRPALPGAVWFTACAWCERIKLGGRWVQGERALAAIRDVHALRLTHGICPACFNAVTLRADEARRQQRSG